MLLCPYKTTLCLCKHCVHHNGSEKCLKGHHTYAFLCSDFKMGRVKQNIICEACKDERRDNYGRSL